MTDNFESIKAQKSTIWGKLRKLVVWLFGIYVVIVFGLFGARIPLTHARLCLNDFSVLTDEEIAADMHAILTGTLDSYSKYIDAPGYKELKAGLQDIIVAHNKCIASNTFDNCTGVTFEKEGQVYGIGYSYEIVGTVINVSAGGEKDSVSAMYAAPGCWSTGKKEGVSVTLQSERLP